jgi:hypothetical protein
MAFADIRESNKLITNLTIAGVSPVFREMFSLKQFFHVALNFEKAYSNGGFRRQKSDLLRNSLLITEDRNS